MNRRLSTDEVSDLTRRAIDADVQVKHDQLHEVFDELVLRGGPADALLFCVSLVHFGMQAAIGPIVPPPGMIAEAQVGHLRDDGEFQVVPMEQAPPSIRCVAQLRAAVINDSDAEAEMAWDDLLRAGQPDQIDVVLHRCVYEAANPVKARRARLQ